MTDVIHLHPQDIANQRKSFIFEDVKLFRCSKGKIWIRGKDLSQDYGPFPMVLVASGWINLSRKENLQILRDVEREEHNKRLVESMAFRRAQRLHLRNHLA